MNHERLMLKGQLSDCERRLLAIDVNAKGDIALIRMLINPFEPDVTRLKTGEALAAMERLNKAVEEAKELKARVTEMREALNG